MEFFIGIETEGFWKGKAGSNLPGNEEDKKKDFAQALGSCYNKMIGRDLLRADFAHGSHPGHHGDPDNKNKWIVAIDHAIGELSIDAPWIEGRTYSSDSAASPFHSIDNNTDPLELVSPKLTYGQNSKWREDVKKHWAALLEIGEVEVDKGCATHVHVSPKQEPWSLKQLKQVAKAVIYFDDAFKNIWAPTRRKHDLTQSNKRNNYKLENLKFDECRKLIDECANNLQLINLMQSGNTKADGQTRDYAWNFQNTDDQFKRDGAKSIGTIGASHGS